MTSYHQHGISRLLHETLIKLCSETVPFQDRLEVDGIICLSPGNDGRQIVVKVHEVLSSRDVNVVTVQPTTISDGSDLDTETNRPEDKENGLCSSKVISKLGNGLSIKKEFTSSDSDLRSINGLGKCRKRKKSFPKASSTLIGDETSSFNSDSDGFSDDASFKIPKPTMLTIPELQDTRLSLPSKSIFPALRQKCMRSPHSLDHLPLTCTFCKTSHVGFNGLYNHQLECHKRYTCKYCFQTFSTLDHLKRHERLHLSSKSLLHENDTPDLLSKSKKLKRSENDLALKGNPSLSSILLKKPTLHTSSDTGKEPGDMYPGLRISFKDRPSDSMNSSLDISSLQPIIIQPDVKQEETFDRSPRKSPGCSPLYKPLVESAKTASSSLLSTRSIKTIDSDSAMEKDSHSPFAEVSLTEGGASRGASPVIGFRHSPLLVPQLTGVQDEPLNLIKEGASSTDTILLPQSVVSANSDAQNWSKLKKQTYLPDDQSTTPSTSNNDNKTLVNIKTEPAGFDQPADSIDSIILKRKPFKCNICMEEHPDLDQMDEHGWKAHMRFSCHICPQTFSNRNNRARHIRSHTGEREYACQECGKKFSRSDTLKEHQIIHTDGYIVQQCSFCGEKIDKKAALLSHIKKCSVSRKREGKSGALDVKLVIPDSPTEGLSLVSLLKPTTPVASVTTPEED